MSFHCVRGVACALQNTHPRRTHGSLLVCACTYSVRRAAAAQLTSPVHCASARALPLIKLNVISRTALRRLAARPSCCVLCLIF
jgi:hypothetical protein